MFCSCEIKTIDISFLHNNSKNWLKFYEAADLNNTNCLSSSVNLANLLASHKLIGICVLIIHYLKFSNKHDEKLKSKHPK